MCQEPLFNMYTSYMSFIITCHLLSAQKTSKQHFSLVFPFFTPVYRGRAISAPPTRRRVVSVPDISAPFPYSILFFELWRKNNEVVNSSNTVEHEPVPTRVLNPNASYKPKQRSYRKTNPIKKVLAPDSPGTEMSGAEMSSAETYPTRIVGV